MLKYNVLEKEYTKINRQNKFLKLYIKTTFVAATIAATVTLFIVK